ncbi:MAG: hypothetical protein EOM37_07400 [Proteobacteria bacterium]|jgi:hypothetical protein|nr:hypothetical protein [Alphaproteobacteria bacterium]NCC03855.1 hypothetical protein [Pseudomonadota bacterium]
MKTTPIYRKLFMATGFVAAIATMIPQAISAHAAEGPSISTLPPQAKEAVVSPYKPKATEQNFAIIQQSTQAHKAADEGRCDDAKAIIEEIKTDMPIMTGPEAIFELTTKIGHYRVDTAAHADEAFRRAQAYVEKKCGSVPTLVQQ